MGGEQKSTDIRVPALAIFALPHATPPNLKDKPAEAAAFEAWDMASTGSRAQAFEAGIPTARVVRLAHASHAVYRSNEADVAAAPDA